MLTKAASLEELHFMWMKGCPAVLKGLHLVWLMDSQWLSHGTVDSTSALGPMYSLPS